MMLEGIKSGNWESSVSAVTRPWDVRQTNHGSISRNGKIFFLASSKCADQLWCPTRFLFSVYCGFSVLCCVATTPCILIGGCLGTRWISLCFESVQFVSYAKTHPHPHCEGPKNSLLCSHQPPPLIPVMNQIVEIYRCICQLQVIWHPVVVVEHTFTHKQYTEQHN